MDPAMNHNTKELPEGRKQKSSNSDSCEHGSGMQRQTEDRETASNILQLLLPMLGKLPLWLKSLVVVLVLMVSITFFVWRSLPDSSKEKMLEKILPQVLSRQETGQDKPSQVNAVPETLIETDTVFRGLSDTNEAHTVIRETGTSRFREPEMVEIPNKEFSIGKYEVTNLQYKQFLDDNPIWPKPTCWDDPRFNEDRKPVVGVSWLGS